MFEKVLHCFMGSGSTGQAAINLKGNFIGFELDNKLRKLIVQSYFGRELSVYLIHVF
ncbi:DNA methyltransferase [Peribacillus frigoritolerans]|uniref:DNA methyltransferase n=1 Tax=Peribacillus frigoritolerans TaxID=450367 RepID=UPI0039B942C4